LAIFIVERRIRHALGIKMNKKRKMSVITILLCFVLVFSLTTISASAVTKYAAINPEIGALQQLESPNPSVFVRWNTAQYPQGLVSLNGYKVEWKSSKDKKFTSSKVVPRKQTSLSVSGLKVNETYTFVVKALYGPVDLSKPLTGLNTPVKYGVGKEKKIKILSGPTALSFRGNFKLTYAAASLGRLWVKWSPITFDSAAIQCGYELTYQIDNGKVQKVMMPYGNKVLSFQKEILKKAGQQATIKVSVRPYAVNKYTGKLYTGIFYMGTEAKKTVKNSLADF
jgi:hypothetical protein